MRVTNRGAGAANKLTLASAQPLIVDNPGGVAVSFAIEGSSATGADAEYRPGETRLEFDSVPPGGTVEGYWTLTTTRHGYFVDFAANLKHLGVKGAEIDPLIAEVNTGLVPAIGGTVSLVGCNPEDGIDTVIIELLRGGTVIATDKANSKGVYYLQDLEPGTYQSRATHRRGKVLQSDEVTVLDGQPTERINRMFDADLDSDDDGLDDCWELRHFGTLDSLDGAPDADPDGDGLTNAQEFELGTDPGNADTDNDGMTDLEEIQAGLDPLNTKVDPLKPSVSECGDVASRPRGALVVTHGWN